MNVRQKTLFWGLYGILVNNLQNIPVSVMDNIACGGILTRVGVIRYNLLLPCILEPYIG
jgi:hypothetical protein